MNLPELGQQHGTDKAGHGYLDHYQRFLEPLRSGKITLLEIGVMRGDSLRMWRDFFPNGSIYGIDIEKDTCFNDDRIRCFCGKQQDTEFLAEVVSVTGPLTIVIDDGSHHGAHHVISFDALWPHVVDGGWYCIEDCQSMFNDCWTQPSELTMCDLLAVRMSQILTGQDTIREAHIIGNWIYSGLMLFRKGTIRPLPATTAATER
jgi:hypothetical protein